MHNLLYLTHRLPYPPNKGDKVRSFHLLKHLAGRSRVFLGTFIDDPQDEPHVEHVKSYCEGFYAARLKPSSARILSLRGLAQGEALTLPFYRSRGLRGWVRKTVAEKGIHTAVVFCSSMAQYVRDIPGLRVLIDFVDVDSAKWMDYASAHRWPLSWLYRREGRLLLSYEREIALGSCTSFFVTDAETALFRSLAPECASRTETMSNGVDADYFCPSDSHASPFAPEEMPIVFTGAMDYWPNVDAVSWFVAEVLPKLKAAWPRLRFHIVGMRPTRSVQALAGEGVNVTGTVPDVRPYLHHAALVVAPLRVARGIQNKVLEAMAMGKAVVATRECAAPMVDVSGDELLAVETAEGFVSSIDALLRDSGRRLELGEAARRRVLARYSWAAHLSRIDAHLQTQPPRRSEPLLDSHGLGRNPA